MKDEKSYLNIRDFSRTIINAALSFEKIISVAVAFDPTGHAASAWAIISLSLTVSHIKTIRVAQLMRDWKHRWLKVSESSAYLAEVLTRFAYIETKFHRKRARGKDVIRDAIIRTHKAILQYVAEIMVPQNLSSGRRILDSIAAATSDT